MKIRMGTRASKLALIQTEFVMDALKRAFPDVSFEIVKLTTKGDRDKKTPISEFGGKAVFVEDIEKAIRDSKVDLAVHSAKDMPNPCGEGLTIAGVLQREDPGDVLLFRKGAEFTKNDSFVIGTSSMRREYQIRELYPNASVKALRGNLGTRVERLLQGDYDAIILAAAGLKRQGFMEEPLLSYRPFTIDEMIPAAGQAIIAIETQMTGQIYDMVQRISNQSAMDALLLEREILQKMGASCHEPVGVYAELSEEECVLRMMTMQQNKVIRKKVSGKRREKEALITKILEG